MPVPAADANGFDVPRVLNCLLEFSEKAHYNNHSLRIYTFSKNAYFKNNNRNYRKTI